MQSGEILTHLVNNQVANMARRKNTKGFKANYEGWEVDSTPIQDFNLSC